MKLLLYAFKKNQVLLRISNLEDVYDPKPQSHTLDLKSYARELFEEANPDLKKAKDVRYDIEETTLTGVTNYQKRMDEHTKWQTNDGATSFASGVGNERAHDKIQYVKDGKGGQMVEQYSVQMMPQSIRAFKITYHV